MTKQEKIEIIKRLKKIVESLNSNVQPRLRIIDKIKEVINYAESDPKSLDKDAERERKENKRKQKKD